MKISKYLLLSLLFCCVNYIVAQDFKRIEILADMFLEKTNLPGLSIAIAKDGQIVYTNGFGYANIKTEEQMKPSSQLRTASIAKVLTATALGRLATNGKLNFNDAIKIHVPYINKQYENLTIRQLAGHTSGINHRPSGNSFKNKQYESIEETLKLIKDPLLFEPGTDYQYSTNAYNLLAAVIEGASGIRYQDYMRDSIFKPLEMNQTFPENIAISDSKNAELYYLRKGKLRKESLSNGSYKLPGAGFRSTSSDLVKLMNAYTKGMISKEVVMEMFKSNVLDNGEKTNVGIAWRSSIDVFGNNVIEHAGSWRGTRTVLVYYPKEQLTISLMINASCQILIEETAHIFAQLYRTSEEVLKHEEYKSEINVIFNSDEGVKNYKGNLEIDAEIGVFKVNSDNFLSFNKFFAISNDNDYAFVSNSGLLYLKKNSGKTNRYNLYAYTNRNMANPITKKPLAVFKI